MFGLEPGVYIISGTLEALTDANQVTLEPVDMTNARVRDLCAEFAA